MFFELTSRTGQDAAFRLRDKGNQLEVTARLNVDGHTERVAFQWQGIEVELRADRYIPKGFSTPRLESEAELTVWKNTRPEALQNAHLYSSHHREELEHASQCGCYCCRRLLVPAEIVDWTDDGQTAVCPYCGTDAIVPRITGIISLSPQLLEKLNEKYF